MGDNETVGTRRRGRDEGRDERERNDDDECSHMILLLRSFSRSRFDFPIKHENKNTAKIIGFLFYLSPDPLPPALSNLRASNSPPPPWRGMCGRQSICVERAAGWLVRLFPGSCRSLAFARSLLLSDPQAGGEIAICTVFASSFSRHPLAGEAATAHLSAWRMRDLPAAMMRAMATTMR